MKSVRAATDVDAHVGARIRLRRMLIGMSQEKLGDSLGVTFQQIQKYERGANRISASKLYEVSRVLGVQVQHFYDGVETDPKPSRSAQKTEGEETSIMEFVRSPEGLALNRAFAGIKDPRTKHALLQLVRSLEGDANEG